MVLDNAKHTLIAIDGILTLKANKIGQGCASDTVSARYVRASEKQLTLSAAGPGARGACGSPLTRHPSLSNI